MPSHFSTIGMPVKSQDELFALAQSVANDWVNHKVQNGSYFQWSSLSGAELWLQVDRDNNLIGMNPHFAGKSSIRVGFTQRVVRPDCTEIDGTFFGWVEPETDEPTSGGYPLVFDAPDFKLHQHILLPKIVTVQVAAFAHTVSVFDSDEAFAESQTSQFKWASKSYIPSGIFAPGGKKIEPPKAEAIFTGHVLEAEKRTNQLTGKAFYWVFIETFYATYDVVADLELLDELPQIGNVLHGECWLSGCISQHNRVAA